MIDVHCISKDAMHHQYFEQLEFVPFLSLSILEERRGGKIRIGGRIRNHVCSEKLLFCELAKISANSRLNTLFQIFNFHTDLHPPNSYRQGKFDHARGFLLIHLHGAD